MHIKTGHKMQHTDIGVTEQECMWEMAGMNTPEVSTQSQQRVSFALQQDNDPLTAGKIK